MKNFESMVVQALESFSIVGPDGWKKEEPDFAQFVSPAIAHGAMNSVVRARFQIDEMDLRIEAALRPYVELKRNCWWMIGPNSSHVPILKQKLFQRGFRLEHEAFGLALSTDRSIYFEVDPQVSVERVTLESLDDYLRASQDGKDPTSSYRSYFEWILNRHGDRLELFLARVSGEPAGAGLIQYLDGAANLVSGFVRPKFRGRGAYRALTEARIERLRERGVPVAVVLSKAETSAPILMRLGFEKICEMTTLEWIQADSRST